MESPGRHQVLVAGKALSQTFNSSIYFVNYDPDNEVDTTYCHFLNNPLVFWAVDSVYTLVFDKQVSHIKLSSGLNKISILSYTKILHSGFDSTLRFDSASYHSNLIDSNITSLQLYLSPLDSSWDYMVRVSGIISATQLAAVNSLTGFTSAPVVSVYPNPTSGLLFIRCGNTYESLTLTITGSSGRNIFNASVGPGLSSIQLNDITGKGIYFLKLSESKNGGTVTKKIELR